MLITHYQIRVWFLTGLENEFKRGAESKKNDLRNALRCFIKGIDMNCKDEGLNLFHLYSIRAGLHLFSGEFTRLYFFQFS